MTDETKAPEPIEVDWEDCRRLVALACGWQIIEGVPPRGERVTLAFQGTPPAGVWVKNPASGYWSHGIGTLPDYENDRDAQDFLIEWHQANGRHVSMTYFADGFIGASVMEAGPPGRRTKPILADTRGRSLLGCSVRWLNFESLTETKQ